MLFLQLHSQCLNSLFSKLKPLFVFNLPLYKTLFVHLGSRLVLFASFLIVFLDSSVWHSMKHSRRKAKMNIYSNTLSSAWFMSVVAELMCSDYSDRWFWAVTGSGVCIQIGGVCGLGCKLLLFRLHLLSAVMYVLTRKKIPFMNYEGLCWKIYSFFAGTWFWLPWTVLLLFPPAPQPLFHVYH